MRLDLIEPQTQTENKNELFSKLTKISKYNEYI